MQINTRLRQGATSELAERSMRLGRILLRCGLLAALLAGCNSNNSDGMPETPTEGSPPVAPPAADLAMPTTGPDGYYRGTATIGGTAFRAEALVTADGDVRLHVGAATTDGVSLAASVEPSSPVDSLFVGSLDPSAAPGTAQGVVIGQACTASTAGRYCGKPTAANARFTRVDGDRSWHLEGEVRVETGAPDAAWLLEMTFWSIYYNGPARQSYIGGVYEEKQAPFAKSGDVTVSIDGAGRLFFQSPASGCVGNGSVAPHSDGARYVFDVSLLIESCGPSHAFLNGEFTGLATETQSGYWDYDSWLVMFLSTDDQSATSASAMTTLAARLDYVR
jgi:hypothetical protein